jgi:uncharacterized protein
MASDPKPPHTVDVFALARTGGAIAGDLPISAADRLASLLARAEGVLRYRVEFALDDRGRPAARLQWSAALSARCVRCGGPVALNVGTDARFYFVRTEEELNALPIDPEEPEEALLGSRSFDLHALVEDEAILSLPLAPRHARCGDDAHPADEAAQEAERRYPFAVLAQLKREKP